VKQTTVQESRAIRFGSGKVEVGDSLATMVDLGAMRDVMFEETWEKVRVMSDNAGEIAIGIRNHHAAVQGNLMEINLKNLALIRGGLDNYTEEEGDLVDDAMQKVAAGTWAFGKFIRIENQNHDLSEIAIDSVKGDNTDYVEDTDYTLVQDSAGNWGIIVLDTETTDITHHLTINYDYTPAAKKVFSSGGKISIEPRIVRITNTNEEGKEFRITVFAAETENGISIDLPGDEEEDPAMTEIRLEGACDESRPAGEQLFMIEDFQTV
jgi:hypothetical protein